MLAIGGKRKIDIYNVEKTKLADNQSIDHQLDE